MKRFPATLALATFAALAVWLLDATVDVWAFHDGTFWGQLRHPTPSELYMRTVTSVALILVGLFARIYTRRARRAAEDFARRDEARRLEANRAIEEQHLHLQQAQELAHVGSWTLELATGRVTASAEAKRIYGLEGEVFSLDQVRQVPLPEYREELERALDRLVQEDHPYDVEFMIRRPVDGELRSIRSVARYDRAHNRVIGVIQDVTDQKATLEALRTSEERFRSVVEQSSQAIYVLVDDRFELVNPRFAELTGYTIEEVRAPDFDFRTLLTSESLALIERRRDSRIRGDAIPECYDFSIRSKAGNVVEVSASVAPIRYWEKDGILGFLQDVTEQKTLEAQLAQALRMESIGRLSGGVAHDLNNLLSPILGYAGLLMEDLPPEGGLRESAEAIIEAGARARDLVKQLLAFSRQQPLEMGSVDVNRLLGAFDQLLVRTLREDIRIEMQLDPDLPAVNGDRRQIEQVVMNLAVNAQDAMPGGGVITIETADVVLDQTFVEAHPGSVPGRFVRLAVSDTGEGIDPETRRRIFEPFFTTKPKGKGTGLGLSTVYGIVKQHGGYIDVQSEPEHGTMFSCYLPTEESPSDGPLLHGEGVVPRGGSETVLVVEDEDLVRTLVLSVLQRHGYRVLQARSGQDALDVAAKFDEQIDLLLTDVVLPGLSGRELQVKLNARSPHTRVLFMSGYARDVIAERGIRNEDNFLQKPFSIQSLTTQVREVLDAPGVGD